MKRIVAVLGDRGGANAVIPVLEKAVQQQHEVSVVLAGTCERQYQSKKLQLDSRFSVRCLTRTAVLSELTAQASILLLGASQSGEGAEAARVLSYGHMPVVLVEDIYGSAMPILQKLIPQDVDRVRNLAVCVTDDVARELLLRAFPLLSRDVRVTGGPQYDAVSKLKEHWLSRRESLRKGYGEDGLLALVCGGLNGTVDMLKMLALTQSQAERSFPVLYGKHPRSTLLEDALLEGWECLDDSNRGLNAKNVSGQHLEAIFPALTPGFVLSGYSTVNMFALLCDIDAVYLRTPAIFADYAREKYPSTSVSRIPPPPETRSGAAWYVEAWKDGDGPGSVKQGIRDLAAVIESIASKDDQWKKCYAARQKLIAANDGNAAERVWKVCKEFLGT